MATDPFAALGFTPASTAKADPFASLGFMPSAVPAPKPFKFDQKEDAVVKASRIAKEDAELQAKSKKANSAGAKVAEVAKNMPIIGGAIKVGQTLGQSLAAPSVIKNLTAADQQKGKIKYDIMKQINVLRSQGKDTARLEKAYNMLEDGSTVESQVKEIVPKSQISTKQAVGELGELALDTLTAGTYGGAAKTAKTGQLLTREAVKQTAKSAAEKKVASTAPTIIKILKSGTAKGVAQGSAVGEAYDISQNLQANEKGSDILTKGYGKYIGAAIPAVFGAAKVGRNAAVKSAEKKSQAGDDLVGRILQGEKSDVEVGKRVIPTIEGAKTREEAVTQLDSRIKQISEKQDEALGTKTDVIPMNQLSSVKEVGGKKVSHNFVVDALDELDTLFKKTNNPTGEAEVALLKNKMETQGLTVKEVNDIARMHGRNIKGFNASGEVVGITKQKAENTRKGLKETARTIFGDKTFDASDAELSDLYKVRDLFDDVATKANELKQKIVPRKFAQATVTKILSIMDKFTNGALRGAADWAFPRGQGTKVLNALDMEKSFAKDVEKIKKLFSQDLPEKTIIQRLEDIVAGSKASQVKNMLQLPAKGESGFGKKINLNEGRPIIVAEPGQKIDSVRGDIIAQSPSGGSTPNLRSAVSPTAQATMQSSKNPSSSMSKTVPSKSSKSNDRRSQLINALRGEYEAYTPPAKLPVIEVGTVPKKKIVGPVINADKAGAPNVYAPEKKPAAKSKKKVIEALYHGSPIADLKEIQAKSPMEFAAKMHKLDLQPSVSLTPNKDYARAFKADGSKNKSKGVYEVDYKPKKTLDLDSGSADTKEYMRINKEGMPDGLVGESWVTTKKAYQFLKKKGYDSIKVKNNNNEIGGNTDKTEIRVFTNIKPKSQSGLASVGAIAAGSALSAGGMAVANALRSSPKEAEAQTIPEKKQDAKKSKTFVPDKFIDVLVDQESSNGKDRRNEKYDQGKYGWLVGFTKGTYKDIKEKAKTSERWKNLYKQIDLDTSEESARKSAEAYLHFLMRDFGAGKELKDGTLPKNITAKELYRLYNGNGSPEGVESFGKKYEAIISKAQNGS